ncbi:TPA: sulfatase-like hydrolase/transferase [Vibrio vulnificus]|uniref:sulfatase family protein n=1 Tax=Vibrio vulnificus TaxID=672 RepID=UPI001A232A10|nr:sulfatase-like hydrolase/transferase [Vibrio vulnificus]EGQ8175652.1 sulfatase-like hydrolase/transferase [Vibrio vulnificus]EID4424473.1 sulfatase-like hydrolase/transferase [Vibrio vulnificus]EJB8416754.1 sulfatase-like hydrolase/transferase [Vibrio vulnificus]ELM6649596.1 sulfatase-like hydrolase/transferase [Vibrio vulnificus]MCG6288544.1 sulfatase-like hydrolase/transferase [Vibrio vulnificus]
MNLLLPRKTALAGLIAAACTVTPLMSQAAGEVEQPNVLLIVMDDLGTAQLDFALDSIDKTELAKRKVPERYDGDFDQLYDAAKRSMPNITKLANEGVRMTNAYVATPVCGPSRAGMMTGRFPHSFGTYSNDDAKLGIPLDIKLLPALMHENGYTTANIGKYHNAKVRKVFKPKDEQSRDYHDNQISIAEPGYGPEERGFDYSYSYYVSGAALYNSPTVFRNGENVPAPGYLTHNLTNEAIQFIEKADKTGKPFFINLAYSVPHIPLEQPAPAKYMERFNTGNVEVDKYYAHVNASDEGIGRIISKLKEMGEYENTLIFFLSDNGAVHESPMPMNGMNRAFKGQRYRGGVHVPFVAHWKGKLPEGRIDDTMISAMDILPTALAAARIDIPAEMKVDGKDIMPLLSGKKQQPHPYLYWAGPRALHYDLANTGFWSNYWKWITFETNEFIPSPYIEKHSKGEWAIKDQEWSLHYYDDGKGEFELYHYAKDPAESVNLAKQYPDKVKELKMAFYDWVKTKPAPVAWGQDRYQILTDSAK